MSIAYCSIKGLTFYNARRAYQGFTLFTPMEGYGVWMIDMMGKFVHHWDFGYRPGCYGELLPNGNVLYGGKVEDGPLADIEGAGGILLEMDWDGNIVWKYEDPYQHHAFYRRDNGNTLVLRWVQVPKNIAGKVVGGLPGTERNGVMWGDSILEVTPEGKVVWEWIGHEHLEPEIDCSNDMCPRSTWTHANSIVETANGDILVCFMKNDSVAIIDRNSGTIKWRWGANELALPHCATTLNNGNILVFDNGMQRKHRPMTASRVVEVDRITGEMTWSFGDDEDRALFYSGTKSSAQRLPNGNTFICEGDWGRLFEVNTHGELMWEYVNKYPSYETSPVKLKSCPVYSAYRYGMDYSGLKRDIPLGEVQRQAAPSTPVQEKKKVLAARLSYLGY